MPNPEFAVLTIGDRDDPLSRALIDDLTTRTAGLGSASERIDFLPQGAQGGIHDDSRAAAVVFCRGETTPEEDQAITWCRERRVPILPVVEDLTRFTALAPASLSAYNGFPLADGLDVGELTGLVLETLGLQRSKRKVFISYARKDSAEVAHQLHEAFTARWYRVFQDTVSIRPGAVFQEELMQELSDSDVMVLLNSPSVATRPYVQAEIAFADQAGVGGVEVVWPGVRRLREAAFFMPVDLANAGMTPGGSGAAVDRLTDDGVRTILRTAANIRTEVQAYREHKILRHIDAHVTRRRWRAVLHPGRFITLHHTDGRQLLFDLALGLPTSQDMQRASTTPRHPLPSDATPRMLYEPLGITNQQADHLAFLRERLGLDLLDYRRADEWCARLP